MSRGFLCITTPPNFQISETDLDRVARETRSFSTSIFQVMIAQMMDGCPVTHVSTSDSHLESYILTNGNYPGKRTVTNESSLGSCTSMTDGWKGIHIWMSGTILALYAVSILVSGIRSVEFFAPIRSSKVCSNKQDCRHSMIVCVVGLRFPSPKDRHMMSDSLAYSDASLHIEASLYIGLLGHGIFGPHDIDGLHRDISLIP